ncbi:ERF family protein [Enterococcus faecalis]|uniref:ERF family protein n=1 Tax=Enterococcus gallinarum TaxID=1353 RepID=UPI0010732CB3|nr:ERF family protein [Enterococcus gallinarum]MBF0820951.1 ERF family protein [Enterococcus faecalis]MBF0724976.1 ERF family protein [Enterococcus gallinarum]MBF0796244.1 ERF family protein [Enterococcus gallinarum]MBX8979505.1 ERF family protein [Enterococcus gallinarum]NYS81077.1 ERF family protein [Enterococcus gallinarum]
MSNKELTFLERVSLLITELKAPKSQRNNFGKYNYRSAEDILEAVKPLAYKYGLVAKLSDEPVMIGDWHYIKATASIKDVKTGEEEVATAYAREPLAKKGMDESQITGTASSYARKYAMNGLYQIDDTKDADTDEYTEQVKQATPKPITKTQQQALQKRSDEIAELAKLESKNFFDQITEKKIGYSVDISKINTEQLATLTRYLNELEKYYQGKK